VTAPAPVPEFSRLVSIARLGDSEAVYHIEAKAEERAALARRLGLLALDRFILDARLSRATGGGIRLAGEIAAELVQECVVTLEPVPAKVSEAFSILYRRTLPAESDIHATDEEDMELLAGEEIDIGEAAAQQLSLALDPFPRAPGAQIPAIEPPAGEAGVRRPFADLGRLLKK
jgi:uncharacterized metal-binding protein YceD (DUF177 family)